MNSHKNAILGLCRQEGALCERMTHVANTVVGGVPLLSGIVVTLVMHETLPAYRA